MPAARRTVHVHDAGCRGQVGALGGRDGPTSFRDRRAMGRMGRARARARAVRLEVGRGTVADIAESNWSSRSCVAKAGVGARTESVAGGSACVGASPRTATPMPRSSASSAASPASGSSRRPTGTPPSSPTRGQGPRHLPRADGAVAVPLHGAGRHRVRHARRPDDGRAGRQEGLLRRSEGPRRA